MASREDGSHRAGRRSAFRLRQWLTLFALLLIVTGAWSVATPALSGADELAHVRKAEAVTRGQWLGHPHTTHFGRSTTPYRIVRVPATFKGIDNQLICYFVAVHANGRCAEPIFRHSKLVPQRTYVGSYPPLYYLLVGWPSRWAPGLVGVYWMRFLSAVWSSVFLATALQCAVGAGRRLAALGVFAAITPFVTYLAGTVNPSSLEVTAATCLWACGTELVTQPMSFSRRPSLGPTRHPSTGWLVPWSGVAGVVLLAMRATSPLWFGLIAAALAVSAGAWRLRALLQRRDVQVWIGVVAVVAVVSLVWIFGARAYEVLGVAVPHSWSNWRIVGNAFGSTWQWTQQMLAATTLGLPVLFPIVIVGLVAVGGLVAIALGVGSGSVSDEATASVRRRKWVLVALIAGTVVIPAVVTAWVSRSVGPGWQGRYTLPLAVGIPITAGWLATESRWPRGRWAGFAAALLIIVLACARVVDLFAAMRRYAVGIGGPIWFLPGKWQPPLPGLAVLIVAMLAALALAALVCRLTPPTRSAAREDRRIAAGAVRA